MNRIDRLFAILLKLQAKRRLRAKDLAAMFEVNERTIYRDMAALSETGVPIIGTPGEGYALMEGYFVPPLLLTPDEATALILGTRFLAASASGRLPTVAQGAQDKISAVLPARLRSELDRLSEAIHFASPQRRFDLDARHLPELQQAIREHRIVSIRYHSQRGTRGGEVTDRDIQPMRLSYFDGTWQIDSFCLLRHAPRTFRLDRIDALKVTQATFTPALLQREVRDRFIARIRFSKDVLRWVREQQHYAYCGDEPERQGQVMCYSLETLDEIMSWLLSWGAAATPLEPEALRERLRAEASQILKTLS